MIDKQADPLSRRERQIMDILFVQGRATVQEVREALLDPPTYSAVRGLLRVLGEKGHIRHVREGVRYVYAPTQAKAGAAKMALHKVLHTFFGGSVERAVATLLTEADGHLSDDELSRLTALVEAAKSEKGDQGVD